MLILVQHVYLMLICHRKDQELENFSRSLSQEGSRNFESLIGLKYICGVDLKVIWQKDHKVKMCRSLKNHSGNESHAWQKFLPTSVWHVEARNKGLLVNESVDTFLQFL